MLKATALAILLPCAAQAACYERDVLAAYLAHAHDMTLAGWGLTDAGTMHELFMAPDRMWAVIETRPDRCAEVVSIPHQHHGRLADPPRNPAIPRPGRLSAGQRM